MLWLEHIGKCGAINESYPTTMVYYVLRYFSDVFTLQEDIKADWQVSNSGELVSGAEYLSIMKSKKNWYCK